MKENKTYMVFDVESIGLHGEGFAVGYVVVDETGKLLDENIFSCPPDAASGTQAGKDWIKANCPALARTHNKPAKVREAFWKIWIEHKTKGAILVADCCWPVEARFLAQCVDDSPTSREWEGPYPLHDIASILLGNLKDPLDKRERKAAELPEHNPLCDARQSARILMEELALSAAR